MARIRTIKPKFWDDSKIGRISRDARLLYIGLWTFSDDIGVVVGDSVWLKSKVFPYDKIQIQQFEKWILELVRNGFICLLSYKGERFIYLPNFTRHQVINRPNVEDLNISKDLIDSNMDKITEQSLNNHGRIIELSLPIKGEGKGKGKGSKETSSGEEAKKDAPSLEAKEKELRRLESRLKAREEELAKREAALKAGPDKTPPSPGSGVEKGLEVCKGEIASDREWMETVCLNEHITERDFHAYLDGFFRLLQNRGDTRKSPRDAKHHFASWLRIELKNRDLYAKNNDKAGGNPSAGGGGEDFMRNIAEGIARANYEKQRRGSACEPLP